MNEFAGLPYHQQPMTPGTAAKPTLSLDETIDYLRRGSRSSETVGSALRHLVGFQRLRAAIRQQEDGR